MLVVFTLGRVLHEFAIAPGYDLTSRPSARGATTSTLRSTRQPAESPFAKWLDNDDRASPLLPARPSPVSVL
jgi:hypothetical protein